MWPYVSRGKIRTEKKKLNWGVILIIFFGVGVVHKN